MYLLQPTKQIPHPELTGLSFACLSPNIKSAINRTYCRLYTSTFCYNLAAGVTFARLLILRQPQKENIVRAPDIGRIVRQQSLTVSGHVSNSAGKNPTHRSRGNVPVFFRMPHIIVKRSIIFFIPAPYADRKDYRTTRVNSGVPS